MRVEHLLRPEALICAPQDGIVTIARRMHEHQVSALAVLDGDRLVAMISQRDLVHAIAECADPHLARVQDYSTTARDTADSTEDSWQVAQRMLDTGQEHIVVLDGSAVINVVPHRHLMAVEAGSAKRADSRHGIDTEATVPVPARHPSPYAEPSRHIVKRRTVRCAPTRPATPAQLPAEGEAAHVGDAGWWLENRRASLRRSAPTIANAAPVTHRSVVSGRNRPQ
jgi:CBS domain-containing protein